MSILFSKEMAFVNTELNNYTFAVKQRSKQIEWANKIKTNSQKQNRLVTGRREGDWRMHETDGGQLYSDGWQLDLWLWSVCSAYRC